MTRPVPLSPSSRPEPAGPDLAWRPASYWPEEGMRHAILGNILGEVRHGLIRQALESGTGDLPPAELLRPELEPDLRDMLGRIDPRYMGGEYLPRCLPGEVEIARVALESTTCDVTAVRARQRKDGGIRYRIVDEYRGSYRCSPQRSELPLTFGELLRFLDGANPDGSSLVLGPLEGNTRCGTDPETLRGFVTVRSDFYPELEGHCERLCNAYLDSLATEEADDES